MYKKRWTKIATIAALGMTLIAVPVIHAAGITLNVDGHIVKNEIEPVQLNETVLVPMRVVGDAVGASLTWDSSTQTLTAVKGDTTGILIMGKSTATVKIGSAVKQVTLDEPGRLVGSRVMVPVRFLATLFGAKVEWNQKTDTVAITTSGTQTATSAPLSGPKGEKGVKGEKGDTGEKGVKGDTGAAGASGSSGSQGARGADGAVGPAGAKGEDGAVGPAGPKGEDGAVGPIGPAGPKGDDGTDGAVGPAGPAGPAGAVIIPFASGEPISMSTGTNGDVSLLGFGNSTNGPFVSGGEIDQLGDVDTDINYAFTAPSDGTLVSMSAFFSSVTITDLGDSVITIKAQLYGSTNNIFTAVPGAVVTLTPELAGNLTSGAIFSGTAADLTIPITAGQRYMLVYSAEVTGGTDPGLPIDGFASAGIRIQ